MSWCDLFDTAKTEERKPSILDTTNRYVMNGLLLLIPHFDLWSLLSTISLTYTLSNLLDYLRIRSIEKSRDSNYIIFYTEFLLRL